MPSSTTSVTNHQRRSPAIPANMTWLLTTVTNNISIIIATATKTTGPTTPFPDRVGLGAIPRQVSLNIAQVADGVVGAIACQVARLPTVLACLVVGTVTHRVALLEAVVAQPHVARWRWRGGALSGSVPSLATVVADAFVWAASGYVSWFSTVITQGLY